MVKAKKIEYLAQEDIISLAKAMQNNRDKIILLLLYETGCTITELTNIQIKDIKPNKQEIIIKNSVRTNETRITKVSKELIKTIKSIIRTKPNNSFLFSTRQSNNITPKRIQQILGKYKIKNLKITPQIIRYTHIAQAYQKGIAINEITNQVGLKRSRTIEIFSQLKTTGKDYSLFLKEEKNV